MPDDPTPLDASLWGPRPADAQVAAAVEVAREARAEALAVALDGALTVDEAASRLGTTREEVTALVEAGRLVVVEDGGTARLPAWQFGRSDVVNGLDAVIAGFPGSGLSLSMWAMKPSPDLDGRTPADHLDRRLSQRRVLEVLAGLSPAAW